MNIFIHLKIIEVIYRIGNVKLFKIVSIFISVFMEKIIKMETIFMENIF